MTSAQLTNLEKRIETVGCSARLMCAVRNLKAVVGSGGIRGTIEWKIQYWNWTKAHESQCGIVEMLLQELQVTEMDAQKEMKAMRQVVDMHSAMLVPAAARA